jgi:uncharacterized membrane protein YgcG
MSHKKPVCGFALGLGALLALAAGLASADVTTEQKVSIQGIGPMSFADMSGTSKTVISGNRSRTDSDMVMQSKLIRFLARNAVGPTAEIVLLDSDKLYHLNLNKKEYTEQSFEDLRGNMQKALQSGKSDSAQARQQPSAIDQSKCDWLPPKSDVKTGAKGTVAGFDAQQIVITAEQPCKDKETGAICEIALTVDEWLASSFSTNEELTKYHKAYAQKLGLDAVGQDAGDRAKAMFSQYKGVWEDIASKMKDAKGYPVKSSFSLAIGGDQCKQAQTAKQQSGGADDGGGTASSGSSSGSASSSGGSSGSTSPADLANQVGAKLGAFFHRKKDDSQAAATKQGTQSQAAAAPAAPAAPAATGPSGTVPLMTVSSELVSVSTAPIPANAFDVPADFKKVERKGAT